MKMFRIYTLFFVLFAMFSVSIPMGVFACASPVYNKSTYYEKDNSIYYISVNSCNFSSGMDVMLSDVIPGTFAVYDVDEGIWMSAGSYDALKQNENWHRYHRNSFEYGRDSRHVYLRGKIIRSADPATFRILGGDYYDKYAVDSSSIFFGSERISDFESSAPIKLTGNGRYLFYKNDVFEYSKKFKNMDASTVRVVSGPSSSYLVSKDSVYTAWQKKIDCAPEDVIKVDNKDVLHCGDKLFSFGEPVTVVDGRVVYEDPNLFELFMYNPLIGLCLVCGIFLFVWLTIIAFVRWLVRKKIIKTKQSPFH